MMLSLDDTSCCGIKDLNGIQDNDEGDSVVATPFEVIGYVIGCGGFHVGHVRPFCAFIMFSQAQFLGAGKSVNKAGTNLAAYIHKNKLGKVVRLPAAKNPNSGNKVTPFMWAVDWKRLSTFKLK